MCPVALLNTVADNSGATPDTRFPYTGFLLEGPVTHTNERLSTTIVHSNTTQETAIADCEEKSLGD